MNNQDPKFLTLPKDYTNIATILDPKLSTQDRKQAQTAVDTTTGLLHNPRYGKVVIPIESSLNDSKRDHLECSRPHTRKLSS